MSLLRRGPADLNESAIWQDVEYGSYSADLELWERLANEAAGPVVELGSGSGRVALHLARAGFEVLAVELDPAVAAELERRGEGLGLTVVSADVAEPAWVPASGESARLAIAPLQVMQLLDSGHRAAALATVADALVPGGRLAVALVDEATLVQRRPDSAPAPDMREHDGWVYSSEPLWVQVSDEALRMQRMRERVSPEGELVRKVHEDVLHRLGPDELEAEASAAGLVPAGRRSIAVGEHEAGSIVVILERS